METSSRLEIKVTCEPLGETKRKRARAKQPDTKVRLAGLTRRLNGRANPKWLRMVHKWEASARNQGENAPKRQDSSRKARKSKANPTNTATLKGTALKGDRYSQEGCRDGGGILAFVLALEQFFEFSLKLSRTAVFFRGFKRVHGRPIIFPEFIHER